MVKEQQKFKKCSKCKRELPATPNFFYKNKTLKSGLDYWCKECKKKFDKKYHRYKNFNITLREFEKMLMDQNSKCAICGMHFDDTLQLDLKYTTFFTPNIDHDHKTGKIRGIICNRCNRLLGFARDNILILFSAIKYLKSHKK
ncbi:MAG: endonuclease VII domain-containing protein [Promethearchaeota archaeon]